ncbi:MAG: hypothetical protein HY587_08895 [Candidatus Omnitrophica bacterium]|nr:hypothetical protein [Candidatus Omnitrophota bacterium]
MRYAKKRKKFLLKLLVLLSLFFLAEAGRSASSTLAGFFPHNKFFHSESFHLIFVVSLFAFLYRPIDHFIFSIFRRVLSRCGADYSRDIEFLYEESKAQMPLKELGNLVVNTLAEALGSAVVTLLVLDRKSNAYAAMSSCGLKPSDMSKLRFTDEHLIVRLAKQENEPLVRDELIMHFSWQEANVVVSEFQNLRAAMIVPVSVHGQLIALCAMGLRAGAKAYTAEDKRLFQEFSSKMGRVLGQALAMHELESMNLELRDKQATLLQSSKLSAIEQLASGFAHQIHNPLTIISGKAQVLLLRKEKMGISEEVARELQTIVKETRRAADITHKLAAFSRPRKPVREPLDFSQIVEDALSLISYQASLDSIQVIRHIQKDLPPFIGTVPEFRELFLNLLLNAVDAMSGGGTLMIKIRHLPATSEIEIKVSDSGKGIPAEHIPMLFDPFFSTRHDRAGLGLFIVQKIVYHYGGTIKAESQENQGTVFVIRLPVLKSSAHPSQGSSDSPASPQDRGRSASKEVHQYA